MKVYRDTENRTIYTVEQIKASFEELKARQPFEYDYTINDYLKICTDKNGFLEELESDNLIYDAFNDIFYTIEELAETIVQFGDFNTYEEVIHYIEYNILTNNKNNTDLYSYADYLKEFAPYEN